MIGSSCKLPLRRHLQLFNIQQGQQCKYTAYFSSPVASKITIWLRKRTTCYSIGYEHAYTLTPERDSTIHFVPQWVSVKHWIYSEVIFITVLKIHAPLQIMGHNAWKQREQYSFISTILSLWAVSVATEHISELRTDLNLSLDRSQVAKTKRARDGKTKQLRRYHCHQICCIA